MLKHEADWICAQMDLSDVNLNMYKYLQNRRRRQKRRRRCWSRAWLGPDRQQQFGLYDQLMTEMQREDSESFNKFMRMPPEMFEEILD